MKIKIKTILTNEENIPFMGIGVMWLLERTIKFGSINAAAKDMRMSYCKAIKIVKSLEKNLNKKILISKIGGKKGGGSSLTNFGINFLQNFQNLDMKIKTFAEKEFEKFLKRLKNTKENKIYENY